MSTTRSLSTAPNVAARAACATTQGLPLNHEK
jgi:hypothetical protein